METTQKLLLTSHKTMYVILSWVKCYIGYSFNRWKERIMLGIRKRREAHIAKFAITVSTQERASGFCLFEQHKTSINTKLGGMILSLR